MSEQDVTVKATPLLAAVNFINESLTPAQKERVYSSVAGEYPEATHKVIEGRILTSDRFPVLFTVRLVERAAEELHRSPLEVGHQIGRKGAENAAGGILRLALAVISVPNLLRKLDPVWSQLYSHGRMTTTFDSKRATIEMHDFPIANATLCARITGWFEWFAQKAEKTAIVDHNSCRARGGEACRWSIAW